MRNWLRPRRAHSLLRRWFVCFMVGLPAWPLMHLFLSGPWFEGLGSVAGYSLLYAVSEWGYFHVYGGTDEDYPNPPDNFRLFF